MYIWFRPFHRKRNPFNPCKMQIPLSLLLSLRKSVALWKHKYTLDATNLSFVFPPVVNNNSSTHNACCNQTTKREIQRFHFGVSCARYKTKNKRLCTITAKISRIKYQLKSFQRRYWDIVLLPKANFSPASFLASSLREISSMTRQGLR